MLLPLRLPTGLRSVDGVREPRRLYPPSPPPWIGNDYLYFSASPLPAPSPLITLTPCMCYVPPRPHPHRLNKSAGFWFSACSDSSSPRSPAPCVRYTLQLPSTSLLIKYVCFHSPLHRCFTRSYPTSSPSSELLFHVKKKYK